MGRRDYIGWREASRVTGIDLARLRDLANDGTLATRTVVDEWGQLDGLSADSLFAYLEQEDELFIARLLDTGVSPSPSPVPSSATASCPECGAPIPPQPGRGRPRRYCSERCRWRVQSRTYKRKCRAAAAEQIPAAT